MARQKGGQANLRKYYLFGYNLVLFFIHFFIFFNVLDQAQRHVFHYSIHYPLLILATSLQFLDLFHAYLGWTKTSISAGLIQIFGRLFVLWTAYYVELDSPRWSTQVLCLAYMFIELCRYPYYAVRVFNKDFETLTWLRYNAWLICYPLGLSMEFLTLHAAFKGRHMADLYASYAHIPILKEPVFKWGIEIVFLFVFFPYLAYTLLSHMWRQRQKKNKEMSKKKH